VIDLNQLIDFEWDAGSRVKNWQKHAVSEGECEEVFFNLPLLVQPDPAHSTREPRYLMLGHTNAGRYLFIAFTVRKEKIRVISARNMSQIERTSYEQADSKIQE
jgi:uncharacterized DUF497 family protein